MNIICVLHVSIIKLEKRVNGSEKSSGKEPEDTQDSKGQVRWDMRTAYHRRDLDSIAGFWPHVHPYITGGQFRVDLPRSACEGR